ncbi:prephenate dehydrogenase [Butyrivibrio sp. NC3005]|uniref:prephenate dehydrogenase n=1 Tax=Butyrivibrio sp. NC3005 TaxID=1280685 RepID=UPI0003F70A25|nr:prephenate dehydrogenase [Butyrivibrio sp. NC3005]
MKKLTCFFLGLGLIGGSIAKALKTACPKIQILAYDTNKDSLEQALNDGIIDNYYLAIGKEISDCDYIFLCAPVSVNISYLEKIKPFLSEHTTLTDIGSVKSDIHNHIKKLGLENQFIGGHPMAGSERIGYTNSKASLLENAYYILTRTPLSTEERIKDYYNLVKLIGAIPLIVDAKEHDYIVAAISHLPHVVSASLVNLVKDSDMENGLMKMVAAGGFKDITRISSSSPIMWQQICLTNSENITLLLDKYIESLTTIRDCINEHKQNDIIDFFSKARSYRESFQNTSAGPIKKVYTLHVDIEDHPGMLAAVVTLLAAHNINIKNVEIRHNREFESGTLRIEFENEKGQLEASALLKSHNFLVVSQN